MGACYSKGTTGTRTLAESKAPKQKLRISLRNRNLSAEGLSSEKVPLKDSEKSLNKIIDSPDTRLSRTSTPDLVPDHVNLKQIDHSIAPSDSGIESIGTGHDDTQGSARLKLEGDELLRCLEHQTSKICHNCGHLKLHSGQTGTSTAGSQFGAHILHSKESSEDIDYIKYDHGVTVLNGSSTKTNSGYVTTKDALHKSIDSSKSDLKKSNEVNDASIMLLLQSTNSSSLAVDKSKNKVSGTFIKERNCTKAPLAQSDSLDTSRHVATDKTYTQQELPSGVQNIKVCECGSYCSEYSDTKDHGKHSTILGNNCVLMANTENVACAHSEGNGDQFNYIVITGQESLSHINQSSVYYQSKTNGEPSSEKLYIPASLSKNVSFASHEETRSQTLTSSARLSTTEPIPVTEEICVSHIDSSMSESSSGVYTYKTPSGTLLSNGQKGMHQSSASHDSVEPMMSDSSSDSFVSGTDDDMTSLDLDNISRPQSNSSTRPLTESREDVASPLQPYNSALPATVDGRDCVIIPKETYHQMQADLSVLKHQLLCLSSLIQEPEGTEHKLDSGQTHDPS